MYHRNDREAYFTAPLPPPPHSAPPAHAFAWASAKRTPDASRSPPPAPSTPHPHWAVLNLRSALAACPIPLAVPRAGIASSPPRTAVEESWNRQQRFDEAHSAIASHRTRIAADAALLTRLVERQAYGSASSSTRTSPVQHSPPAQHSSLPVQQPLWRDPGWAPTSTSTRFLTTSSSKLRSSPLTPPGVALRHYGASSTTLTSLLPPRGQQQQRFGDTESAIKSHSARIAGDAALLTRLAERQAYGSAALLTLNSPSDYSPPMQHSPSQQPLPPRERGSSLQQTAAGVNAKLDPQLALIDYVEREAALKAAEISRLSAVAFDEAAEAEALRAYEDTRGVDRRAFWAMRGEAAREDGVAAAVLMEKERSLDARTQALAQQLLKVETEVELAVARRAQLRNRFKRGANLARSCFRFKEGAAAATRLCSESAPSSSASSSSSSSPPRTPRRFSSSSGRLSFSSQASHRSSTSSHATTYYDSSDVHDGEDDDGVQLDADGGSKRESADGDDALLFSSASSSMQSLLSMAAELESDSEASADPMTAALLRRISRRWSMSSDVENTTPRTSTPGSRRTSSMDFEQAAAAVEISETAMLQAKWKDGLAQRSREEEEMAVKRDAEAAQAEEKEREQQLEMIRNRAQLRENEEQEAERRCKSALAAERARASAMALREEAKGPELTREDDDEATAANKEPMRASSLTATSSSSSSSTTLPISEFEARRRASMDIMGETDETPPPRFNADISGEATVLPPPPPPSTDAPSPPPQAPAPGLVFPVAKPTREPAVSPCPVPVADPTKGCRVIVGTWNVGAELPTQKMLHRFLFDGAVPGEKKPDVVLLGFQEVVELSPQNILLGGASVQCNANAEKLISAVETAVNSVYGGRDAGQEFALAAAERIVGLVGLVFVRRALLVDNSLSNIRTKTIALGKVKGLGKKSALGNKGAVCVSFTMFHSTSICFVTSHIAAHRKKVKHRVRDYNRVVNEVEFRKGGSSGAPVVNEGSGDARKSSGTKNLLSAMTGGRFGEGRTRKSMARASKRAISSVGGFGTLEHSTTAPATIRKRIVSLHTSIAQEMALRASLAAATNDSKMALALKVLDHDVAFFCGDLNFRFRPLLRGTESASELSSFTALSKYEAGDDAGSSSAERSSSEDLTRPQSMVHSFEEGDLQLEDEEEEELSEAAELTKEAECKLAFEMIERGELNELLQYDQLLGEQRDGTLFQEWDEMPIDFQPTYKYVPGSDAVYDSGSCSGKVRLPAWCDRVMFSTRHRRGGKHIAQRMQLSADKRIDHAMRAKNSGVQGGSGSGGNGGGDDDDDAAERQEKDVAAAQCNILTPLLYTSPPRGAMVSDHRPVLAAFEIRPLDPFLVRRVVVDSEEQQRSKGVGLLNGMKRIASLRVNK